MPKVVHDRVGTIEQIWRVAVLPDVEREGGVVALTVAVPLEAELGVRRKLLTALFAKMM